MRGAFVRLCAFAVAVGIVAGCVSDKTKHVGDIDIDAISLPSPPHTPDETDDPDYRLSGPAIGSTSGVDALARTEFYVSDSGAAPGGGPAARVATRNDEGKITLNFVDAPIAEVVDVVLGDILKENYSIGAGVQGMVTTRTSSPLNEEDVFAVLENLLALKGASLVKTNGIWHVLPTEEARRLPNVVVSADRRPVESGQAIHFIPLEHAAAGSMVNVLTAQITPGRQLIADADRNLMIFIGPTQEAKAIEDMVAVLDVDALKGKLFALIPVEAAPVDEMVADLQKVFEGSSAQTIRFIPIKRLNAILAIARQPGPLNKAQSWVSRLDRANTRTERQAFVYYVRNGRATELAKILADLFDEDSDDSDSAADVAPGLKSVEVSTSGEGNGESVGVELVDDSLSQGKAKGPKIIADERNNALVITGTEEEYDRIEAILSRLDITPLQVLIDVIVAEVKLTGDLEHGVEWYLKAGDFGATFSSLVSGSVTNKFPGFGMSFETADAKVVLNALDKVTDVDVISSPKLTVLDNQSARLQVGDQVPVISRTSVSTDNPDAPIVNTVEMVDTGVILEVKPTVNTGGLVSLQISQEVSDATTTITSDIDSPTIQKRKIDSTLAVQSGETVALAGLMRDRKEVGEFGLPVLRKIPVLGNLFKTRTKKGDRTELLVLITPHVIRNPAEMRALTDELRHHLSAPSPY